MSGILVHETQRSRLAMDSDFTEVLALSGVAKSSTSFGWGKGRNVTSAGWQVTLCDPMWHVSSRSGVATLQTALPSLVTYLLTCVQRVQ